MFFALQVISFTPWCFCFCQSSETNSGKSSAQHRRITMYPPTFHRLLVEQQSLNTTCEADAAAAERTLLGVCPVQITFRGNHSRTHNQGLFSSLLSLAETSLNKSYKPPADRRTCTSTLRCSGEIKIQAWTKRSNMKPTVYINCAKCHLWHECLEKHPSSTKLRSCDLYEYNCTWRSCREPMKRGASILWKNKKQILEKHVFSWSPMFLYKTMEHLCASVCVASVSV